MNLQVVPQVLMYQQNLQIVLLVIRQTNKSTEQQSEEQPEQQSEEQPEQQSEEQPEQQSEERLNKKLK